MLPSRKYSRDCNAKRKSTGKQLFELQRHKKNNNYFVKLRNYAQIASCFLILKVVTRLGHMWDHLFIMAHCEIKYRHKQLMSIGYKLRWPSLLIWIDWTKSINNWTTCQQLFHMTCAAGEREKLCGKCY